MKNSITSVFLIVLLHLLIQDGVESKDQDFVQLHVLKRQSIRQEQQSPFQDALKSGDVMKLILTDYYFSRPVWQTVMIYLATPEELADPVFRARWGATVERVKKIKEATDLSGLGREEEAVIHFYYDTKNSVMWKGLIALSSPKVDLMNPTYRAKWGLGKEVPSEVRDSQDTDSFFQGPQFKEFLAVTGQKDDVDPSWSEKQLYEFLTDWFATVFMTIKKSDRVEKQE